MQQSRDMTLYLGFNYLIERIHRLNLTEESTYTKKIKTFTVGKKVHTVTIISNKPSIQAIENFSKEMTRLINLYPELYIS